MIVGDVAVVLTDKGTLLGAEHIKRLPKKEKLKVLKLISGSGNFLLFLFNNGKIHVSYLQKDVGNCEWLIKNIESLEDVEDIRFCFDRLLYFKNGLTYGIGENCDHNCEVDYWENVIDMQGNQWHSVGLKSDGTVISIGANNKGQCETDDSGDIVEISAGYDVTVGLKVMEQLLLQETQRLMKNISLKIV